MNPLTTLQRHAVIAICVLAVGGGLYFAVFNSGKAASDSRHAAAEVKVLQDEIKKNTQAEALRDDVERASDGDVDDWMQSNGYYRED